MKKLLALGLVLLLALPLLIQQPSAAPAQAEAPAYAIITLTSVYGSKPSVTIEDAAFLRWLQSLLSVDAPCDPLEAFPAHKVYEISFYGNDVHTYTITYDALYNQACVKRPDGTVHNISINMPEMLYQALYEQISFSISEQHRTLLQQYGWTVAFRHPHMLLQLPARLKSSRTDAAALHFTWADLFLRDAGYDITPYLGKAVIPYVYTLYETMPRAAFYTDDTSDVRCAMRAVVLEHDGQIIGAYLMAYSWDGSNLMSLKGNAAPALLGEQSVTDYLLARLPVTDAELAMAALTPEEVITRYGSVNDPQLMAISVLLQSLGTASANLYNPFSLMTVPTGETV